MFTTLFIILGFYLKEKLGLAFKLTGFTLMMVLGIVISGSGIAVEEGEVQINISGDNIIVNPTTQSYNWLNSISGAGLLLLGLTGFFISISSYLGGRSAYGKGNL